MVDAGGEVDFGRLEGVVCRKLDGQKEDTARVRRVGLERGASAKLCIDRDGAASEPGEPWKHLTGAVWKGL